MERKTTYEGVLELIERQAIVFNNNLERERLERERSRKEFEKKLKSERLEREKSRKEFEKKLKSERLEREKSRKEFEKSRKELNKRLGDVFGTWGKFVTEMVRPKITEMFQNKGIPIETSLENAIGYKNNQKYYEIDILLINSNKAVIVEVKSTLKIEDVDEHLERIEKIREIPPRRIDLSGVSLIGAIAGMIVENDADRYAYKNGLYVLRQKGDTVEIVNDEDFEPKEWKVNY